MPPPRILVADDEPDVLEALKLLLKGEGYDVQAVTSPRALLSTVEAHDFDALLIDMNFSISWRGCRGSKRHPPSS